MSSEFLMFEIHVRLDPNLRGFSVSDFFPSPFSFLFILANSILGR